MTKFRKLPVEIEAQQFWITEGKEQGERLARWCGSTILHDGGQVTGLLIPTLEGEHIASHGDWIIRGVAGEFYPCKPDIFDQTYEEVP